MAMSMSYCRMENTYRQLKEAREELYDKKDSESEERYRKALLRLCQSIVDENEVELRQLKKEWEGK